MRADGWSSGEQERHVVCSDGAISNEILVVQGVCVCVCVHRLKSIFAHRCKQKSYSASDLETFPFADFNLQFLMHVIFVVFSKSLHRKEQLL